MKRIGLVGAWTLIVGLLSCLGTFYLLEMNKMTKVHELEFPLMLEGSGVDGHNYLLPRGTKLYFEKSFPEGFARYRIYVNVEGVNLESREQNDPTTISPLTAYPIGKAELIKLLREYPISKDELASILRSGSISKEEIKAVLEEFSR
jgi:hypothetical protein